MLSNMNCKNHIAWIYDYVGTQYVYHYLRIFLYHCYQYNITFRILDCWNFMCYFIVYDYINILDINIDNKMTSCPLCKHNFPVVNEFIVTNATRLAKEVPIGSICDVLAEIYDGFRTIKLLRDRILKQSN